MFTVIPAIDLKNGCCVRLRQGRADDAKVYSENPAAMAAHWASEGATYLHVVDLDGAFRGAPAHGEAISAIVRAAGIPVEVGGGIRTDDDIRGMLDRGVDRVIVGTRALQSPADLSRLAAAFGRRLAVGIDARDGRVQVKGWVETSDVTALDLARLADQAGVETIVFTDTATDGMLRGPNLEAVGELCRGVTCAVIASGGITSPADVAALCALRQANLAGGIVGKALYEGVATLRGMAEAAAAAEGRPC